MSLVAELPPLLVCVCVRVFIIIPPDGLAIHLWRHLGHCLFHFFTLGGQFCVAGFGRHLAGGVIWEREIPPVGFFFQIGNRPDFLLQWSFHVELYMENGVSKQSPVKTKHTQKDLMAQVRGKSQFPRESTAFLISQMVFDLPSTVWISLGGSHVWLIGPWWSLEPKDPGPWDPFLAWRMAYKACQVILPNPNWDDLSVLGENLSHLGICFSLSLTPPHLLQLPSQRWREPERPAPAACRKHGFQTKTPISDKFSWYRI